MLYYTITQIILTNIFSHQVFSNSEKGSSSTCANPSKSCQDSKYRTIDGSCNNLKHTEWGMSETPYWRLVQNNYGDGKFV